MSKNTNTVAVVTPYAAAKQVNAALEAAGLSDRIPPQMMYNYTTARVNKGKKPLIAFDAKTGVNQKSLDEWTKAYVAKKTATVTTDETADANA